MNATDLRIGNLVNQGDQYGIAPINGYQLYVFSSFQQGASQADYYKQWKPVVLNEEWLLKFGFVKTKERLEQDIVTVFRKGIGISNEEEEFNLFISTEEDDWYSFKWTEIKFVHQLQNLYFVLTGDELTLK